MRIMFINNHGGGFADFIDVEGDTTVAKLFFQKIPGGRPEDFVVRVNREPASRDQALREGDRVTITPTKIEGAAV
ncbi:MAG: molybdopterin converting factor [Planctomycetaceae bacterium]|nr:molybdopterin converting factor [Planctomycetaceae bacterium]MCA9223106.1 molybdopterin converting factor [Planctomycetales bacterium]